MDKSDYIFGMRAVIEAVTAGKDIDKILIRKGLTGELAGELFDALRPRRDIVVQRVPSEKLERITRKNHQGVIAFLSAVTYYDLDGLVPTLFEEGKTPLIVALDGVTDVRNFGAIARTCECAGVDAIVIPERGSATANADAVKTSAGALLHIPVAKVHSLNATLKELKDYGFAIAGATEKSQLDYTSFDLTTPLVIVMGAEETGISAENLRICDYLASIPMLGKVNSLNVSVAAGIMIYEAIRQRRTAQD